MPQLYNVDSPINREQRNNINSTFEDIQRRFSSLRNQISILTGGSDLEEVIQRIEDAITNSNNNAANAQQIIQQTNDALNQLQAALDNSNQATTNANQAVVNVTNEVTNLQNIINQFGNAETYDNAKTYQLNNIVEYNGSSFIAIQQTIGNLPPLFPLKRNDYWQLLAQRGVDGTGSVASVNSQNPDPNGNVLLTPANIGAASSEGLNNLSQTVSTLRNDYDNHLISNPPFAKVIKNTPQMVGTGLSTLVYQVIQNDFEDIASLLTFGRLTVRRAGVYSIDVSINVAFEASATFQSASIRLNGTDIITSTQLPAVMSSPTRFTISSTMEFNVGDFLEVVFEHYNTNPQTINSATFSLVRLGG